jgi:hypothetical protein
VVHDEVGDEIQLDNASESDIAAEKGEETDHGKQSEVGDVDEGAMTRLEEGRVGVEVCERGASAPRREVRRRV